MFKDQQKYLYFMQITSDMICLSVVYFLIVPLFISAPNGYFSPSLLAEPLNGNLFYKSVQYLGLSPVFILFPPVFMVVFRLYRKTGAKTIKTICWQSLMMGMIAVGILSLLFSYFDFSLEENKSYCLAAGCSLLLLLLLNRIYLFHLVKKSNSNDNLIRHILLVGTELKARSIANYIRTHPESGLRVTGFLTNNKNEIGKTILNKKILGSVNELNSLVHNHYTDCVLVTVDDVYAPFKYCLLMGIDFAVIKPFAFDSILPKTKRSEYIGEDKIYLFKFRYYSPRAIFFKRVLDFTISTVLIVLCLPLWIVISILIKATSPGPVIYRQERIGKYGKTFILFKFRSMIENADQMQEKFIHLNEMDGPAFKIKNDPRQTSVGAFLRKSSLDELPQLFNVFRGDISLVGPRPALEDEVVQYRSSERKRLSVPQGITCLWQVSGRNDIKFDEWMKLDSIYIDNRSTALDIKILLKTIPAVLLKKGAY